MNVSLSQMSNLCLSNLFTLLGDDLGDAKLRRASLKGKALAIDEILGVCLLLKTNSVICCQL